MSITSKGNDCLHDMPEKHARSLPLCCGDAVECLWSLAESFDWGTLLIPTGRGRKDNFSHALRGVSENANMVFFKAMCLRKPYLILTEKENLTANRYYDKIGAEFIRTYQHHGREMNIWHKNIA